jgi:uncharacterized protein (TIGR02145 family)
MRLFFSTLVFFCFATASAQCTYGDIEITVTGSSNKRIILTNTANGESFQSYDTSPNYDYSFFPEALNSVSEWERLSGGGFCSTNINISWVGYTLIDVYGDNNCFTVNLSSLSGGYDVQPDGSVILYNDNALTSFIDPEAPVLCNTNGNVEITVTGSSNKRIILTNTENGESFQSSGTSTNYDYSFFPEALNSVSEWEPLNGTLYSPNLEITWDGYSILTTNQTECFLVMMEPWQCCDNSSDCFQSNLSSLSGEYSVQPEGGILLLTACEAPIGFCDCNGGVLDECGVCGGDNSTCTDCAGVVNGEAVEDCAGVCGGTSVIDECGVCGGGGIAEGTCDCDGNVIDECGVCGGGNSSCSGCTNANATNYDSTATIDDGSCMYNQEVYDGAYAAGVASVVCPDGGSSCPGDLDNDGAVATTDLLIFLAAYGGTCEVDEDLGFSVCGDDINHEGYDYSTVLIGDQCWFAENSRYLPEVSPSSASSETSPLYYVYGYEGTDVAAAMSTSNYETYGVLYNWPAVMTEDICPSGWHIPSDGEWQTMEISLGMPEAEAANEGWRGSEVAYQMKSTCGWNDYNGSSGNGSNSSGFDGRPGGYADSGGFSSIGNDGNWWSSAPSNSNPYRRALFYYSDNVFRGNYFINNGLSARCVRD